MMSRLGRWFWFSLVASVTPLAIDFLWRTSQDKPASLGDLVLYGQLVLVAIAVSVPAWGALIFSTAPPGVKLFFVGAAVPTLLVAGGLYAILASDQTPSTGFATWTSLAVFGVAVPVAAVSIAAATE